MANGTTDLPSTGRFRILTLTSSDLLDPESTSATTLNKISALTQAFPQAIIEQIIVYPRLPREFSWDDIPANVKIHAEMRFYNGYDLDDTYKIYGVSTSQGAVVVVRPDGYVGVVAPLDDTSMVEAYLRTCIRVM